MLRCPITLTEVHGLMSAVLDGSSLSSVAADHSDELNAIALNATKAEEELERKPTVDLVEGFRRTVRWLCATLEPESPALVGARFRAGQAFGADGEHTVRAHKPCRQVESPRQDVYLTTST